MSVTIGTALVKVESQVRVIPAKRSASFSVPVDVNETGGDIVGRVNIRSMSVTGPTSSSLYLPKTLYTIDAFVSLLEAMRAELIEQGVTH
jgi:hypothetical protein